MFFLFQYYFLLYNYYVPVFFLLCSHLFLSHPHTLTPSQISLLNLIDKSGSECLNENDSHPFTDAIAPGDGFLESDCDEQLVVMLAFQQPVKLHSLQLVGPDDGEGGEGGEGVRG